MVLQTRSFSHCHVDDELILNVSKKIGSHRLGISSYPATVLLEPGGSPLAFTRPSFHQTKGKTSWSPPRPTFSGTGLHFGLFPTSPQLLLASFLAGSLRTFSGLPTVSFPRWPLRPGRTSPLLVPASLLVIHTQCLLFFSSHDLPSCSDHKTLLFLPLSNVFALG